MTRQKYFIRRGSKIISRTISEIAKLDFNGKLELSDEVSEFKNGPWLAYHLVREDIRHDALAYGGQFSGGHLFEAKLWKARMKRWEEESEELAKQEKAKGGAKTLTKGVAKLKKQARKEEAKEEKEPTENARFRDVLIAITTIVGFCFLVVYSLFLLFWDPMLLLRYIIQIALYGILVITACVFWVAIKSAFADRNLKEFLVTAGYCFFFSTISLLVLILPSDEVTNSTSDSKPEPVYMFTQPESGSDYRGNPTSNRDTYSTRGRRDVVADDFSLKYVGRQRLRDRLKDPDSLEIIEERLIEPGRYGSNVGYYAKYRAKNSFGGYMIDEFYTE